MSEQRGRDIVDILKIMSMGEAVEPTANVQRLRYREPAEGAPLETVKPAEPDFMRVLKDISDFRGEEPGYEPLAEVPAVPVAGPGAPSEPPGEAPAPLTGFMDTLKAIVEATPTETLLGSTPIGLATKALGVEIPRGMAEEVGERAKSFGAAVGQGVAGGVAGVFEQPVVMTSKFRNRIMDELDRIDAGGVFNPLQGDYLPSSEWRRLQAYQAGDEETKSQIRSFYGPRDPRESAQYQVGESIRKRTEELIPINPAFREDFFTTTVGQGVGSTIPFLATGTIGAMAGMPAYISAGVMGMMSNGAEAFREALAKGASIESATLASNLNAAVGVTEAAPIASFLNKLDRGTGGTIKRALADIIKQGTEEALQEGFQQIMGNLIASDIVKYDPERGLFEGVGTSAGAGFTVGGLMATLAALALGGRRLRFKPQDAEEKETSPTGKTPQTPAQGELFPSTDLGIAPPVEGPGGQFILPGFEAPLSPSEMGMDLDTDPRQGEFFDEAAMTQEQQYAIPFEERFTTPQAAGLVVVPKGQEIYSPGGPAELMSLEDAGRIVGENPAQSVDIYQVRLETLEASQVTSQLAYIPQDLTPQDPNVYFVSPNSEVLPEAKTMSKATREELAFAEVNKALVALRQERFSEAKARYSVALDMGFRYRPQAFGGIDVVGRLTPGQFTKLRQLPNLPEMSDVFVTGFNFVSSPNGTMLPSKADLETYSKTGTRFFQLTKAEANRADITLTTPPYDKAIATASGWLDKKIAGVDGIVKDIANNGVSFVPGADLPGAIRAMAKQDWHEAIKLGARFRPGASGLSTIEAKTPLMAVNGLETRGVVEVAPVPDFGRDNPFAEDQILGQLKVGRLGSVTDLIDRIAESSNLVDVRGNSVSNFDKLGPVTVMDFASQARDDSDYNRPPTARDEARFKRFLSRMAKQYENLMKEFGIKDQRIIILPELVKTESGLYGYYTGNPVEGLHIIHINYTAHETARGAQGWATTGFHEFGHFLESALLSQADMATIESLHAAFKRRSLAAKNKSQRDAFIGMRGFDRMTDGSKNALFASSPEHFTLWWDFDEWFAEQTTRWAFSNARPVTLVDKFFQAMGRALKKAAESILGVKEFELHPEVEFENFLEDMRAQRKAGIPPKSPAAINFATLKSQAANGEISYTKFGIKPNQAPTKQAASHAGYEAADNNLLEFGDFSKNEFKAGLDFYNRLVKWGFNVLQLAIKNRHLSGLQRYVEYLDLAHNFKMGIISNADRRISEWTQVVNRKDRANFDRFLFDLTEMKYLKQDEAARQPTEAEEQALARRHGLSQAHVEFSRLVRKDFSDFLNTMEETFIEQAKATFVENQTALQQEISRINQEFDALRQRPYIPMMRFGKYTLDVIDKVTGERVWYEQNEGQISQRRRERILRRAFPNATIKAGVLAERFRAFQGLPPQMIRAIVQMQVEGLTKEQQNQLEALAFQFSPSQSFTKRLLRRKGVAGFDDDALRGYASYFFHGANSLMRTKYRHQLQGAIDQVWSSASTLSETANAEKRGEIANFLQNHLDNLLNPRADWAVLRSLAFNWHLGLSVKSAVLNLTQVPMVAYPYLAARFSDAGAIKELGAALKDVHEIYKATGANPQKVAGIPQDEFRALQKAMEEGYIDEGQATALASLAEGSNLQRALPGTPMGRFIRQASHWSGFMFQQAEMLNRRVVFRAAYRLARANPNVEYLSQLAEAKANELLELTREGFTRGEALAYLAGKDAVRRTQFEYAAWARPRFMQGKAATLFTFFNFMQNMMFFAAYSPGNTRYLLILLASAGLMGLPGAEDLFDIADAAYRKLSKMGLLPGSGNLELETRAFIKELGANPDLMLHGLSSESYGMAQLGAMMGLPIPSVDLSGSLGMGQIVPGLSEGLQMSRGGFEESAGQLATGAAGAAFSIPINFMKALGDDHPDWYKRWSRTFPAALRGVTEAWRLTARGGLENRSGAIMARFDPHDTKDMAEIVARGLGFNLTRTQQRWDASRMQQEAAMFWTQRKTLLMQQWDEAMRLKDRETLADVMRGVRRYNRDVPWPSMRLGPKALRQSLIGRMKQRILTERGLLSQRSLIPMSNEVLDLFPDLKAEMLRHQELRRQDGVGEIVEEEEVR